MMKRLIPIFLTLCLLLAACTSTPAISTDPIDSTPTTQATESPSGVQQLDISAISMPAVTETIADDRNEIFRFTHQDISLFIPDPGVAEKIFIDFGYRQDQHYAAAENIHDLAMEMYDGNEWSPYLYSALYDPMRIDENVLSLAGTVASWSGGSHPNYNCVYANYDMVTGDAMTLGSILTHKDKAADLGALLIDAIAQIQEEKSIWSDYVNYIEKRFAADISYDDAWYFDANGLCFRFTPYEIAPYSSGIITVTIPYSKLTGIIEDNYFPMEQQPMEGSLQINPMESVTIDTFSQFAELVLDKEGARILLSTDSILYNVCIRQVGGPNYIALRAATLTPGDAILVQADFESTELMVEYTANETVYQKYIVVSGNDINLVSE